MPSLLDDYTNLVAQGDIKADPFQEKIAARLNLLQQQVTAPKRFFAKKEPVQGVYIHGGVGRGKSMLMDLFYAHLPQTVAKKRIHFHAFMIETHDWLHEKRSKGAVDDLLPLYAKHVAAHVKILCFDEFHVTDIADAMILSRLFTALMDMGVVVVATSNWPPDRLYEGGLQRDRFLPFIALLKNRLDIMHLDSNTDYRAVVVQDLETYLFPLNSVTREKADLYFKKLSDSKPLETMTVRVKGRNIPVQAAGGAARFTFSELCEHPHGAEDYLKIAQIFHSVFIEGIPKLGYDRNNETKRLMTLIDVLYDMRKRVVITAESAPDKLYFGHDYKFEFDRTISRLKEMQSSAYTLVA